MPKDRIKPMVGQQYIKGVLSGHGSPEENAFHAQSQARYDRLRSCVGKVQHVTFAAAQKFSRAGELSVYECRHCSFFHVGHPR